ncbi:MAG: agmatine deiminase family protein [Candidatus Thermoplasmatota archaeon]|nr:agmatine deiminase family protein [Candidatus Thermoplasmatota archaeon]
MRNASEEARQTPAGHGFSMPAEWNPHAGCFISWPCRELTWHGHFENAKRAYSAVVKVIDRFDPVTVLADRLTAQEARSRLGPEARIVEVALDDSWSRDNGPIFVRNEDNRVALVNFRFNGWGHKQPCEKDDMLPILLAERLRIRRYDAPMVLEGGAISVDGDGTLLTTEQCLLNANRNPSMCREEIEQALASYLGIRKVVWLARGLEDDMTDGHVDGVAGFAMPHVVLSAHTDDDSDSNYRNLKENLARLESATDAKGRSLELVSMVQPKPILVGGVSITPSYVNLYFANGAVVFPTYGIREDDIARETLVSLFPEREIVGVRCEHIGIGGGDVHCITQQLPTGESLYP